MSFDKVNTLQPLSTVARYVLKNKETARYIYMLSLISKRELTAGELENFMDYSIDLCDKAMDVINI